MSIPAVLTAAAAPLAAALLMPAVQTAAPQASATDVLEFDVDRYDRLTVPVRIQGTGPWRFLIDTGSERTVLSRRVAERLKLPQTGQATLLGVAGSVTVETVAVDEVTLGRRSYYGLSAPLLEPANLGADGIIGLDGLQEQRVLLDFDKGLMAVDDARALGGDGGFEIVVRARRRSGQLIMTNATIDGVHADVIIDTGSQGSIANRALQRALTKRRAMEKTALVSVTGQEIPADVTLIGAMSVGPLRLGNISVAFADAPPFAVLGLAKKPAMFLGMNELRAFRRVAIDFETRKVLFDLPVGYKTAYD